MNIAKEPSALVFVYGTLKGMSRGEFIGEAHTMDSMMMYDGSFPVIDLASHSRDNRKGRVLGQLFRVSFKEMDALDTYEGFPHFYDRTMLPVSVRLKEGATVFHKAWIYHGREDMTGVMTSLKNRNVIEPDDAGFLAWNYDGIPF